MIVHKFIQLRSILYSLIIWISSVADDNNGNVNIQKISLKIVIFVGA